MSERVAAESIATEKNYVHHQNDGAESDTEILAAGISVEEPHCLIRVGREDNQKNQRRVEEVSMNVLNHQRQKSLAAITVTRFADSAIRRIRPEALVVRSSIVVAGESEAGRKRQDQERR